MNMSTIKTNLSFNECACYQWQHNISGFNYWNQNETCQLLTDFTTNYVLLLNTSSQFCFINQPTGQGKIDLNVAATVPNLRWNLTGIAVVNVIGSNTILKPYGVFIDDQYYVYIAEKDNNRTSKWPPNSNGLETTPVFQTLSGQLNAPPSLYVNTTTDDIYVADELNYRVAYFKNGSTNASIVPSNSTGTSPAVAAIYLDPNGTIFITDSGQHRVYNWFTNETVAGGQGNGTNANQLTYPKRFFIDNNFTFYIADSGNNRIQKWLRGATTGETVAGGNGAGTNANQLSGPLAVVVDTQGNIIVCDSNNNRIQRWSRNATVGETIAGNANGTAGSGPKELDTPKGIALDKDNNLYVADYNNNRVQKFNVL